MAIDPVVPAIGFVLIAANVLLAVLSPYLSPAIMGLELFVGGLMTLVVSVVDIVNPLGIGPVERFLAFAAGSGNCFAGYYMVLQSIPFVRGIRRMLTTIMGAAVFSVGFFMLLLGLMDLLGLGGLSYGAGERILLYVGGLFLCILGYIMARRLPRAPVIETAIPASDFPAAEPPADQV